MLLFGSVMLLVSTVNCINNQEWLTMGMETNSRKDPFSLTSNGDIPNDKVLLSEEPTGSYWKLSFKVQFTGFQRKGDDWFNFLEIKNYNVVFGVRRFGGGFDTGVKSVYVHDHHNNHHCEREVHQDRFYDMALIYTYGNFIWANRECEWKRDYQNQISIISYNHLKEQGNPKLEGSFQNMMFEKGPEFKRANSYGYIHRFGKFFCRDGWTPAHSKLVCKVVYNNRRFISGGINDDWFPSLDGNRYRPGFRLEINGEKVDLQEDSQCHSNQLASLYCVDVSKEKTDSEVIVQEERRILILQDDVRLCMDKDYWDAAAQDVCTEKYENDDFDKQNVPGYAWKYDGNKRDDKFYLTISDSDCSWTNMRKLDDEKVSSCGSHLSNDCPDYFGVQCAKCDHRTLVNILNEVKLEGSDGSIVESLMETLEELQRRCHQWDCSVQNPKYVGYCQAKNFLTSWRDALKETPREQIIKISTEVAHFDLLKHHFFKESFDKTVKKIKDAMKTLSEAIGDYFFKIAQYDASIAQADIAYALDTWTNAQKTITSKQMALNRQLDIILLFVRDKLKLGYVSGLMSAFKETATNIVDIFNPAKWFTNPDIFSGIRECFNAIIHYIEASHDFNLVNDAQKDNLGTIRDLFNRKVANNQDRFNKLSDILKTAKEQKKLSPSQAKDILKHYLDFTPAITQDVVAEYGAVVSKFISFFCEKAKEPSETVLARLQQFELSTVKKACNDAETNIEIILSMFNEMESQQFEVMESFASAARAMIATEGAENIISSLRGGRTKVEEKVNELNALLISRQSKRDLIIKACNQMTYMEHGTESKICKKLMENPDQDIGELIYTPVGTRNMCDCPTCQSQEGTFLLPAVDGSTKNFTVLDIAGLYKGTEHKTEGAIYFRIPGESWLRENLWITESDKGPFFLERFLVVLPPQGLATHKYQISMRLLHTTLNGQKYMLENGLRLENTVTENPLSNQCDDPGRSPYSIPELFTDMGKICVGTPGKIKGIVLPRLEDSLWKISLDSKPALGRLYPESTTTMYFKVKAKFCHKSHEKDDEGSTEGASSARRSAAKRKKVAQPSGPRQSSNSGNNDNSGVRSWKPVTSDEKEFIKNKYFDIKEAISSKKSISQSWLKDLYKPCPSESSPRFEHYFCEKCPERFIEDKGGNGDSLLRFGCKKRQ